MSKMQEGKPCVRCGSTKRYISDNKCVPCRRKQRLDYQARNPEAARERCRRYYHNNLDKVHEKNRRRSPEEMRKYSRQYLRQKPEYSAFKSAKHRASLSSRTPPWANHAAIKRAYAQARLASIVSGWPHHVDHVIPLNGSRVSGLHVESNLQVIPYDENLKKGNDFSG